MKIDLHNHTTYSDGVFTPEQLVLQAKKNNVDIFALTDHDSVFGIDEILKYAKMYNVSVIPGIELSTEYDNESIHIVGLFKDGIVPQFFKDFSIEVVNKRKERAIKMMEKIRDIYHLNVDFNFLLSTGHVITRGNMLRCLMHSNSNLGMEEARKYINHDSKAYIPSTKLSTIDGLKMLKENDAISILAHPTLLKKVKVENLLKLGFDGIEARYPDNKEFEENKFQELADKYNMFISAGSDCHGDKSHADIGFSTLNEFEFEKIKKLINYKEVK